MGPLRKLQVIKMQMEFFFLKFVKCQQKNYISKSLVLII